MTDDEKAYWDGMMAQINVKLDDILDKLSAVRADTKLEDEMRKRGGS
jgi:hypothetical protein